MRRQITELSPENVSRNIIPDELVLFARPKSL